MCGVGTKQNFEPVGNLTPDRESDFETSTKKRLEMTRENFARREIPIPSRFEIQGHSRMGAPVTPNQNSKHLNFYNKFSN